MIRGFKDRRTRRLYEGGRVREFEGFAKQAARRLRILDAADTLAALSALPGNRLELLGGDRKGQHSIRINDQWRICFVWREGDAWDVEITDYH